MSELLDNTNAAPEQGQADSGAEDMFEAMYRQGEEGQVEESQSEEVQAEEEQESQEPQDDGYLDQEVEVGGKKMTIRNALKSYEEAQKKISQKTEKERYAEQIEQAIQANPKIAKAIQLAAQNQDFAVMIDAFEKGLINREQLQKVRNYLENKGQSQTMSNMPDQNQLQQYIDKRLQQERMLIEAKTSMERQFDALKNSEYKEVLDKYGINFENLGQYALKHKLFNDNGFPDMKKAVNHYLIDNQPDVFKTLMTMGRNEAQKATQQKQQAKVENSSVRQQNNSSQPSPEEQFFEMLQNAGGNGGGVPGL